MIVWPLVCRLSLHPCTTLAEQSFGVVNTCTHRIVFELCLIKEEEEERRKKMNKSKFSCLVFSTLLNVSGVFRVDLAIE